MIPAYFRIPFRLAAFLLAAVAPFAAMAGDDSLKEVVISATLAESPLARTPASVTVLHVDQLDAAGLPAAHHGCGISRSAASASSSSTKARQTLRSAS
jgi:hypothetical protein